MLLIHLRRGAAVIALPALAVVLVLRVALRSRPWVHEWLWTFDQHAFACVLLGPLVAGVATWDAASWAGSKEVCAVADRPASALLRSWLATTLVAWGAFVAALVATAIYAAAAGAPGGPPAAVVVTVAPALAVLALCTAAGAAVGWRTERVLAAPVVAIVVFGLLIASYTTLPGLFVEVGGATSSLIGLEPRPGLQAAQVLWCSLAAAGLLTWAERRWWLRLGRIVLTGALLASTAWVLSFGGERFRPAEVHVRCDDGSPSICLVDGYEHLRAPLHRHFARARAALAETGVADLRTVTQDPGADAPGTIRWYGAAVRDDEDVVAAIMPMLVPGECRSGDPREAYDSWMGIHDWLAAIVTSRPPDELAPAEVRQGGDAATRWVVAAVERLRACAP